MQSITQLLTVTYLGVLVFVLITWSPLSDESFTETRYESVVPKAHMSTLKLHETHQAEWELR